MLKYSSIGIVSILIFVGCNQVGGKDVKNTGKGIIARVGGEIADYQNRKMKIKENLLVIEEFFANEYSDNANQLDESLLYLERATHIYSEADGTIVGRLGPVENDYRNWVSWYEKKYNVKWTPKYFKIKK